MGLYSFCSTYSLLEEHLSANKAFYCPSCRRVYFLPTEGTYLCNKEENFGLPRNLPWAIPEFADYDASARAFTCLFTACGSPADRHPTWRHNYALLTREQIVEKYKAAVLVGIPALGQWPALADGS